MAWTQDLDHLHGVQDVFAHASEPDTIIIDEPIVEPSLNAAAVTCDLNDITEFAALTKEELYDAIIAIDNPRACINPILFGFHPTNSPIIFSDEKVNYIANRTKFLAASFNGEDNNGAFGAFVYLSIAGNFGKFYSDRVPLSEVTWGNMEIACANLAKNQNLSLSDNSLYTIAHMLFTASFEDIGAHPDIMTFAKDMLDGLANDNYVSIDYLYPYYYCYYYLLDVYLRYPYERALFLEALAGKKDIIESLGNVGTNLNLNDDTFQFFDDLSYHSVSSLTRFAPETVLQDVMEPALNAITEVYPPSDSRWVESALSLVRNGMEFPLNEDEIIDELRSNLFPNQYSFEDGTIQIETPLSYDQCLSLYQAMKQVKSQFFRLLQDDSPVAGDTNDTLYIKLYGTRNDYRSFNNILFQVNYPNSGGVYIERQATFYTYERTPQESSYSLEDLLRHEYVHYLQGRFLIPGYWGETEAYQNNRLVWFEEGMAQFLAASTKSEGIKSLNVIKGRLESAVDYQDLTDVFNSSYFNNNSAAFYTYSPMLWAKWYEEDRGLIYDLFHQIRNNDLSSFDATVAQLKDNTLQNTHFHNFIDEHLEEPSNWISPQTLGTHQANVHYAFIDEILQLMNANLLGLEADEAHVCYDDEPRQFCLSGTIPFVENGHSGHEKAVTLDASLNELLNELEGTELNNFQFSTAYYKEVQSGSGTSVSFVVNGPINDICDVIDEEAIQSQTFADYTVLFADPSKTSDHQFRFRSIEDSSWTLLEVSHQESDTIFNLLPLVEYEYQMRLACELGLWTDYTASKTFSLCPEQITVKIDIEEDKGIHGRLSISMENYIAAPSHVVLYSKGSISFEAGFEIEQGASLVTQERDCQEKR